MMRAKTRDAELSRDLTQDAVIEVLKALRRGQLRELGRLIAFVHGVARNVANNYMRTRRDDTGHDRSATCWPSRSTKSTPTNAATW